MTAAAGGKFHPRLALDGMDLMPLLTGADTRAPHEILFWRYTPSIAVRKGAWKLVRQTTPKAPNAEFELYNLETDISEKNNVAGRHPDLVRELRSDLERLNKEMVDPLW